MRLIVVCLKTDSARVFGLLTVEIRSGTRKNVEGLCFTFYFWLRNKSKTVEIFRLRLNWTCYQSYVSKPKGTVRAELFQFIANTYCYRNRHGFVYFWSQQLPVKKWETQNKVINHRIIIYALRSDSCGVNSFWFHLPCSGTKTNMPTSYLLLIYVSWYQRKRPFTVDNNVRHDGAAVELFIYFSAS